MRRASLILVLLASCFDEPSYENLLCSLDRACPDGLVCEDGRCVRGSTPPPTDAGVEPKADCAPCDRAPAACIENDTIYRAYVNLGVCPEDPAQCSFAMIDMACASCSNTCLIPCRDLICDDLQGGCRQAGYCVPSPSGDGAACAYVAGTDSSTCTTALDESGLCASGVCVALPDPTCDAGSCDDHNPCTDDTCDASGTCANTPNTIACDDGDPCTYDDRCQDRVCGGTAIVCESDDCMERACDGTSACSEQPRPADTPCADDSNPCTTDACDNAGTCRHPGLPNGTQCGAQQAQRCCGTECVDISTDERHCGGCNTACDSGFACEPIESTPDCGASYPANVSGRCLCNGANSQCPDNRGQVCRLTIYLDGNRCVPDSSTAMPCSAGETVEVINMCPGYCAY